MSRTQDGQRRRQPSQSAANYSNMNVILLEQPAPARWRCRWVLLLLMIMTMMILHIFMNIRIFRSSSWQGQGGMGRGVLLSSGPEDATPHEKVEIMDTDRQTPVRSVKVCLSYVLAPCVRRLPPSSSSFGRSSFEGTGWGGRQREGSRWRAGR